MRTDGKMGDYSKRRRRRRVVSFGDYSKSHGRLLGGSRPTKSGLLDELVVAGRVHIEVAMT